MLEQSVGKVPLVPFEATVGADGLIDLAKSYEELSLWVQALMCLKEAEKREPGRNDVAAMYVQFQHDQQADGCAEGKLSGLSETPMAGESLARPRAAEPRRGRFAPIRCRESRSR